MAVDLPRDEVHCWYVDLAVPAEAEAACYAVLADGERHRSDRYRFDRDRRRFIVAHGTLRRVLGRYLGTRPEGIGFVENAFGKPGLRPGTGRRVRFNLSHSDDLAVVAVAHACVGVDVERVRVVPDWEEIARCHFPAAEAERLDALPESRRADAFLRAWTEREAYAKARGEGLAMPSAMLPAPAACDAWSLHALRPPAGHVGSLVIQGSGWRLSELSWPAEVAAGVPERCETAGSAW